MLDCYLDDDNGDNDGDDGCGDFRDCCDFDFGNCGFQQITPDRLSSW